MRHFHRSAANAAALLTLCAAATAPNVASAQLIGAPVTGFFHFDNPAFFPPTLNFFDNANDGRAGAGSGVPATGFGNSALLAGNTTVTIGSPIGTQTFGWDDGHGNLDIANFTGSQLTITETLTSDLFYAQKMTFTDPVFAGLTEVSDGFPNGGFTGSLTGDVVTANWAGGDVTSGTYQAVFNVATTPEPGALPLLAVGGLSGAGMALRRRRNRL